MAEGEERGLNKLRQTEEDIVAFLTFRSTNFAFATSAVEIWEMRLWQYQGKQHEPKYF